LAFDANSKVACETLVTTGQVILAGEVKSNTYLDVQQIARDVIKKIGYTKAPICLKPILAAYFLLFTNNQQI
jgi:S-adenosylmethionine synthetase